MVCLSRSSYTKKKGLEQVASRVQTQHLAYKSGIWRTKLAFRLQICTFRFTNRHLALQTGASNYNSARLRAKTQVFRLNFIILGTYIFRYRILNANFEKIPNTLLTFWYNNQYSQNAYMGTYGIISKFQTCFRRRCDVNSVYSEQLCVNSR